VPTGEPGRAGATAIARHRCRRCSRARGRRSARSGSPVGAALETGPPDARLVRSPRPHDHRRGPPWSLGSASTTWPVGGRAGALPSTSSGGWSWHAGRRSGRHTAGTRTTSRFLASARIPRGASIRQTGMTASLWFSVYSMKDPTHPKNAAARSSLIAPDAAMPPRTSTSKSKGACRDRHPPATARHPGPHPSRPFLPWPERRDQAASEPKGEIAASLLASSPSRRHAGRCPGALGCPGRRGVHLGGDEGPGRSGGKAA
jgi:hypothetical protein